MLLAPAPSVTSAYESFVPPIELSRCVERIHLGYELRPHDAPIDERVLPDGSVHLLFNLGEAPAIVRAPPQPGRAAEALGASTGPVVIRMAGHVEHVGVRLRPGGVAALLGVPAGELTGKSAPLDALWGPAAREAHERLATTPRGPARLAVALGLDLAANGADLTEAGGPVVIHRHEGPVISTHASGPRVGVAGSGGDAGTFPWRYWLTGERTVSAYRPAYRPPASADVP